MTTHKKIKFLNSQDLIFSTNLIQIFQISTGCPGVLIVKRAILPALNSPPTEPGGGTVFYVTEDNHRYSM